MHSSHLSILIRRSNHIRTAWSCSSRANARVNLLDSKSCFCCKTRSLSLIKFKSSDLEEVKNDRRRQFIHNLLSNNMNLKDNNAFDFRWSDVQEKTSKTLLRLTLLRAYKYKLTVAFYSKKINGRLFDCYSTTFYFPRRSWRSS